MVGVVHDLGVASLTIRNDDTDVEVVQCTAQLSDTFVDALNGSIVGEVETTVVTLALALDLLCLILQVELKQALTALEGRSRVDATAKSQWSSEVALHEVICYSRCTTDVFEAVLFVQVVGQLRTINISHILTLF